MTTLDLSDTGYGCDQQIGFPVKTSQTAYALVGLVRTNSAGEFVDSATQRWVLSYHRRRGIQGVSAFSTGRTTTSTSYIEPDPEIRVEFLIWADEVVRVAVTGSANNSGAAGTMTSIGFDAGNVAEDVYTCARFATASVTGPIGLTLFKTGLSEGAHYATLLGKVESGTGTWWTYAASAAGIRTSLQVEVQG